MQQTIFQVAPMLPHLQAVLESRYRIIRAPSPDATAVLTNAMAGLDTALLPKLPNVKIIAINGVGFDKVDLVAARDRGIVVTNTPDVLTDDVADLAIGLMLNVMRRLPAADRYVRDGRWAREGFMPVTSQASHRRYGIVGMGRIGQAIAARLAGFGGSIAYTSRTRKDIPHIFHDHVAELAANTDVLFLAAPASPDTINLIDRKVLDALGPQGVLINIGRGALVDEPALVAALMEGRLGGAGLDVFADEPNVPEALFTLPNVALAPHVGSATQETRSVMGKLVLANLDAFFCGEAPPTRVV